MARPTPIAPQSNASNGWRTSLAPPWRAQRAPSGGDTQRLCQPLPSTRSLALPPPPPPPRPFAPFLKTPTAQVANAVYVVALAHLVRRPGDAAGALATADGWLKGGSHDGALKEGLGPVRQWWLDDSRDWARAAQELDCGVDDSTIGWLRWALTLSAAFLRRCCDDDAGQQPQVTYEEVVCAVLERGGDTDTNAAIVGAVVGALLGARAGVPEFAKGPVLAFDPTVAGGAREGGEAGGPCKGHQRPAMYGCGQLPQLAARLLRAAPGGA